MSQASPTSAADTPPDPPKDPPATTLPENIDALLHVARILLTYGRHLLDTIRARAAAPNFNAIAANFGTTNLTTILAHLNRGILRCIALERVLLARAAAGEAIPFTPHHTWQTLEPQPDAQPQAAEPAPPAPDAQPQAAEPLLTRKHPRASRPAFWDNPELHMPTVEDLERQIRRLPMGRVFLAIALDLGVVPAICHPGLWSALSDIMIFFSSGNTVAKLMQEKTRRRAAFDKEQDSVRDSNWDWVRMTREALRQVLGFFVGEPPVNPLDPAAAIATAPP
jgi:hypothetical protein